MFRVILKSAATAAALSCLSIPAQAVEVYFFKGAGDFSFVSDNLHFSRGLNKMADTLNAEGIHAEVRRFGAVDDALRTIRARKPETIALVGHSMGALASMGIARRLKEDGIRIVYMGLIDIPGPVGTAGENVEWVENYYSIHPVYGKLTNASSHPRASNTHVFGYIHNRMDDSPKVQNGMLSAIRQVHAAEQEPVLEQTPETLYVQAPQTYEPQPSQPQPVQQQPIQAAQTPLQQPQQPQQQVDQTVTAGTYQTPYQLPVPTPQVSVGTETYVQYDPALNQPAYQQSANSPDYQGLQPVDPMTTASTTKPTLLSRGRSLLKRAGNYVRGLNDNRDRRAMNRYSPVGR